MKWTKDLSVWIGKFDEQHKRLIDILNQLREAHAQGRGKQTLAQAIERLHAYASSHFASEEQLMTRHGYPDLESHHREHMDFAAKMEDFEERLESPGVNLSGEVIEFLEDWLATHIKTSDKSYASFFKDKGVS